MSSSPATIPLPPLSAPSDPVCDRLRRQTRAVEIALTAVVLVFAFLLASSAVRNADFWLHLATGRLIAEGRYHIGVDPFSSTTEGITWVNHSWAFDALLYQGYQLLGDRIVVVKGLLIALLAGVMMSIRRGERGLWAPALTTGLALLAASPRLLFQPMLVSLLFEVLTIWLLARGNRRGEWLLPVLFALWVNLDAWFFLGPVTVALFALAERSLNARVRQLALVLVVGLGACLLNPHHVLAFQLPMELAPAVQNSPLLSDARFQRLFESPWHTARYVQTSGSTHLQYAAGWNAAGLAYFVLLGLGVLSFLGNRSARWDWRLPVWALFTALGAYQLRLVPMFAVVSGPIIALNLQDLPMPQVRNMTQLEALLRRGLLLRTATLLAGLALVALAWPGWLQATPHEQRRVDWAVRPEPSLKLAAETMRTWFERGEVATGTPLFTNHPDIGAYLAWYCPAAKSTIDPRLKLFTQSVESYLETCSTLTPAPGARPVAARKSGMRDHALYVLYDADAVRAGTVFAGPVLQDPANWPLLFIGGRTVVVGHRAPLALPDFDALQIDMAAEAYGPDQPLEGSAGAYAVPPSMKQLFVQRPSERAADGDTATLYLRYFDEIAQRRQQHLDGNPVAAVFADVVAAATGPDVLANSSTIVLVLQQAGMFIPFLDPGPPEAALLAVRSCRRALAQDANDANAWLRLGQAYLSLRLRTREGAWAQDLPLLGILRHVQIATALENALRLNPDLILAHRLLANVYSEREFLDLALEHRRREIELTRAAGPAPGEKRETFANSMDTAEKRLREMEKQVQEKLNQYIIQAGTMGSKPLDQARIALQLGLARKALDDVLLKSDVRLFGINGAQLQLSLLLMTGRVERVRDELAQPELNEKRESLDFFALAAQPRPMYPSEYRMLAFDWFSALLGAATGNYQRADESFRAIDERTHHDADEEYGKIRNRLAVLIAAEIGAFARPEQFIYQTRIRDNRISYEHLLQGVELARFLRADLLAVAGIVAVERGDTRAARRYFEQSLELARRPAGDVRDYAGRAPAEVLLGRLKVQPRR